jgi:choline dehydrogenase
VYLRPWVRARPNLAIHAHTEVCRIVFAARRAVAVEAWTEQGVRQFPADHVILTAGAIHTPLALYRSGVGPRAELDRLGVERVAENEHVGARLLDHPGSAMFFAPRGWLPRRNAPLIQNVLRLGSERTSVPFDIQIQAGSKVPIGDWVVPGCSVMLGVGKPFGTGKIHWPHVARGVKPVIHSALLDDPRDLAMAVDAMEIIHRLSMSAPMWDLGRPLVPLGSRRRRREDIEGWIRRFSDSGYHPSGTVPMGLTQQDGATDGQGRVFGVEGLFVGDASLMPTIPSSNTNLPTLMMAEHLATLWRDSW